MSQPYVGEIRLFAGNFAPVAWAFCDGQLMPISENETLFQLIGTQYGGDGQQTFALPDLRSRVPIHFGQGSGLSNYALGENGGVESVTLTTNQIATHTHTAVASSTGQGTSPANAVLASATSPQTGIRIYGAPPTTVGLHPSSVSPVGGNQPHENAQPTLGINFIIALFGFFPHT
jgi:microcystin-dependent protein